MLSCSAGLAPSWGQCYVLRDNGGLRRGSSPVLRFSQLWHGPGARTSFQCLHAQVFTAVVRQGEVRWTAGGAADRPERSRTSARR